MYIRVKKASGRVVYIAVLPGGKAAISGFVSTLKIGSTKNMQTQKPTKAAATQ